MNAAFSKRGLLHRHASSVSLIARTVDAAVVALAGWLAFAVRWGHWLPPQRYQIALLLGALLTLVVFPACGIYQSWRGQSMRAQLRSLVGSWLLVAVLLATLGTLTKTSALFSRQWMMLWFLLGAAGLPVFRTCLTAALRQLRMSGWNRRRIVLMGDGALARETAKRLAEAPWTGFEVAAFFADAAPDRRSSTAASDNPTLPLAQLAAYMEAQPVDEVWFALSEGTNQRVRDILRELRHCTAAIRYVPDIQEFRLLNPALNEIAGMPVLDLNMSPMRGISRCAKTLEDKVLASLILLLASPLMLAIAVGVKFSSPGPIIFKQRRHGWNGQPIKVYKFRTMVQHTEKAGTLTQARCNDPRVTRFGAFLRRTSLDELPQFINVLQGRMSIVGPRPHAIAHNEEYRDLIDAYMQRHKVKPGITGWAQINGWRGETDCVDKMKKRVEFDLYYIEHWSLWLDLKIIALTPLRGLVHQNAY